MLRPAKARLRRFLDVPDESPEIAVVGPQRRRSDAVLDLLKEKGLITEQEAAAAAPSTG